MTKITANIILLTMAAVWAYLSIDGQSLQEVSQNFITLGLILAGGDIGAAAIQKYGKGNNNVNDNSRTNTEDQN